MKIWYPAIKVIMMKIIKGEFIVRIVFLCIKSQNSGLKIEGFY